MNASSILTKIFAREFYRLNAGFFLIVVGIAFGFMRDVDHIALGQFFISSPASMLIPIFIWALYAMKIIAFNKQVLKKPENEFSFHLNLLPFRHIFISLSLVIFSELAPASVYALFLIVLAIKYMFYTSALLAVLGLLLLHSVAGFILYRDFKNPNKEVKISFIKRWLDRHWSKPYYQIVIEWLAREEFFTLLGSKMGAYSLLWAVLQLYKSDSYDLRLVGIGATFAFLTNIVLLYHIHRFENFHFSINRNLPRSFTNRAAYFMIVVLLVCLPETGLLITRFPSDFSLPAAILCAAFGLSLLILIYGILFYKDSSLENVTQRSFFLGIAYFVLILFKIPLLLLLAINLVTGLFLWKRYYYSFEYIFKE